MTVALITSIYGGYDQLIDPPEQDGVDEYIAVVDTPQSGACGTWKQIVEPRPHMHPRLAAKVAKCRPDLYSDADVLVWMDGSCRLRHGGVANWAVDTLGTESIAQFRHPQRFDITGEAAVSAGMTGKYGGQPIEAQAAWYKTLGLPEDWGLWATGFIVYQRDTPRVLGERWLVEQMRWSYQDQVSEPYVLWDRGLYPVTLDGDLWHNDHLYFDAHC